MTARSFGPNETVDFVVVGSGAAGGVVARELSQAGLTVLVLEQGPRYTAADFRHDELDYWFNNALTANPQVNVQTFRKSAAQKAQRATEVPAALYARMVGGSSNHFTANYWRGSTANGATGARAARCPRHGAWTGTRRNRCSCPRQTAARVASSSIRKARSS